VNVRADDFLSGWKFVQEQMLMQLVLTDVLDGDTLDEGLEALPGLVSPLSTCSAPLKLSSRHVHVAGQHS